MGCMDAIRAMLTEIVDYAGLFPPAQLGMAQAVRNYAAYRCGPHAWMLGRFIVPASRLDEFAGTSGLLLEDPEPWRLSVVCNLPIAPHLQAIDAFHARGLGSRVDTLEIKAGRPEEIVTAAKDLNGRFTAYFEIPHDAEAALFMPSLREAGARAKVRTGGVTPESIPNPQAIARFLLTCAESGVPFKATAGLHHPLRGMHQLGTKGGEQAVMHGFLNVFLAAALALCGSSLTELVDLLNENSAGSFTFGPGYVRWRSREMSIGQLIRMRQTFAVAFGSCSFEEPVADLKAMSLL
jgi:hypothetical protein